jgi:putative transcriptional regulator
MKETIVNKVCDFRKKNKVTQQELADAVGVSRQTISALEKQNYTPSVMLALKISKFFDVCVNELFVATTNPDEIPHCDYE